MTKWLVLLAAAAALVACGGDDDDEAPKKVAEDRQAFCESVADRFAACGADRAEEIADCQQVISEVQSSGREDILDRVEECSYLPCAQIGPCMAGIS